MLDDVSSNVVILGIGPLLVRFLLGLCGMGAIALGVVLFRWKATGQAEAKVKSGEGETTRELWAKVSAPGLVFCIGGVVVLVYALLDKTQIEIQRWDGSGGGFQANFRFSPEDITETENLQRFVAQVESNENISVGLKDFANALSRRLTNGELKLKRLDPKESSVENSK